MGGRQWQDAEVIDIVLDSKYKIKHVVQPVEHRESSPRCSVIGLSFCNHAPLEMPMAQFCTEHRRYYTALRSAHAILPDGLSGRRLNVVEQCIPIQMNISKDGSEHIEKEVPQEVHSLCDYIHRQAGKRLRGDLDASAAVLVIAEPASGKTFMCSQVVMRSLWQEEQNAGSGLIPIHIKVIDLSRLLQVKEHRRVFVHAWNHIDAYVQLEHGLGSMRYRFIRQA
eukprot:SAG31_NODE_1212_length_9370_cov_2.848452_7_plen_223_part_01